MLTSDGKKVSGPIINYTMAKSVKRFKAIQDTRDHIVIQIEADDDFSDEDKQQILDKWHSLVGSDVDIEIQIVEEILPDKSGKLRAFESRIKAEP